MTDAVFTNNKKADLVTYLLYKSISLVIKWKLTIDIDKGTKLYTALKRF